MSLTEKELNEIKEISERWLLEDLNHNTTLNSIYQVLKEVDYSSVIKAFTDRLDEIPYSFSESEKVSGSICFYGGVFTSLLNTGKVEEVEGLFTFALCYMLIDHFLDDTKNSDTFKKQTMQEIASFLIYGKEVPGNKLIDAAKERYNKLIDRNPKTKDYLIALFKSELEGVKVSNSKELDRNTYKKIAWEKGGRTSSAIAQIIGLENSEESSHFICGSMIQFVDDLIDIQDDQDLNIYTLARYDLDRGTLDRYIYETMVEINKLDSIYNFFKFILLEGLILGIHDNPNSISLPLSNILKKYDHFGSTSKDYLNHWFHEKLYGYIQEKIQTEN